MPKLQSKYDVIEWYWPDFLEYCMRIQSSNSTSGYQYPPIQEPTEDNFWLWYITHGPLGLKYRGLFYTKEDVKYV